MQMFVKSLIGALLFLLFIGGEPPDQFPETKITNGLIHARLYLPDTKEGYYRGSRFDWAGVMPELDYKGHTYFGQWFEKYDPVLHDAIMGPVEEFTPVGYDEAKTGDRFLKIGIGMLIKPDEPKYFFANPYQIVNAGQRKIKRKSDQVVFVQELEDKDYAYQYTKTVQLIRDKPEMVLSHSLKNTGRLAIETNVYDHNFFVIDQQPVGPDFAITFPFMLTEEVQTSTSLGKLQDHQILFQKVLVNNEHLFFRSLLGFGLEAKDYDIKIENHKTGASVRITSDQPLSKLVFWSAPKTLCPEPYLRISIKPGETFEWKLFYQFYIRETN